MLRRGVLLLILAAAGLFVYMEFTPYAAFAGEVYVDIPKGASARQIAAMLASEGVIRHPAQFLAIRAFRPRVTLKAGEYLFLKPANAWDVFGRLARGDIFYYTLVVPEGYNTYDIAASLDRQGIMPGAAFLKAAHDPSLVRDLASAAPTLEGYLFPNTYHVTRHTAPEQLCRMMTERFRKAWDALGKPAANVHETVTLASLVEKEAKVAAERPLIASVFRNRLRIGMPLQCDPTTIYAALIEGRYRGAIHRSDLNSTQLYNTYQHPGLPPGPIANPGLDSLRAALAPAASDYLYFVARADGSGAHRFSKDVDQHAKAVQRYRRGLREAEQTDGVARVR